MVKHLTSMFTNINILLAEHNTDLKMQLKISNQDYPMAKKMAINNILNDGVGLKIALDLLKENDLEEIYNKQFDENIQKLLEEGIIVKNE